MLKFIAKKLALMCVMIFIISFVVFVGLNNTGVDPVLNAMGVENLDLERAEELREQMGLDDPLVIRFFRWWGELLTGNFGNSISRGFSIKDGLIAKWPATLELAISALVLSTIIGIGLGIAAAYWQNGPIDSLTRVLAVMGNSVPEYFFAFLLIQVFAVKLQWLPFGGRISPGQLTFFDRIPNMVLPVVAMTIPMCCNLMRYTRNTMLDVANSDFVKLARSKGIPEWKVYTKHIFRNSLRSIVTVLLYRLTILISGSVVVETIFSWPGVGGVITAAISGSDYSVAMFNVLLVAVLMLTVSFLVDIFTALLDPRVRLEV